uniref:PDZ domain-containing protein n=1 Tax=Calcidiscus leptoporus TaxID=127549 RepID=A0A7S0JGR6_9EUKA
MASLAVSSALSISLLSYIIPPRVAHICMRESGLSEQARPSRGGSLAMGLFDGVKDAFTTGSDKPIVSEDRVTPFDRWLGLDKDITASEQKTESVTYVDPSDVQNYVTVQISKPMGLAFVENGGECGGVFVDEVLESGTAASAAPPIVTGDQLVAVDSTLVTGWEFDAALDAIKASSSDTTRLVFFRGPTAFLYGPTKPTDEWYQANLM